MTADLADLTELAVAALRRLELTPVRRDPRPPAVQPSAMAAGFLRREILAEPRGELLGVLLVDAGAVPLAYALPYRGDLHRRVVDTQDVFLLSAVVRAAGLILFHHRPGTDPELDDHDVEVATLIRDAGEVAGVRLLDYLSLAGDGTWQSLRHQDGFEFHALGEALDRPSLTVGPRRDDKRRRVKPKYVNPDRPGETWSGRGRLARWLAQRVRAGERLEDFRIEE